VPVIGRLAPDESGLRRLIADAQGTSYQALPSLTAAQLHDDGVVVLEGDDGGQVYAVFPARAVTCDVEALDHLLRDLDAIAWPGDDPHMPRVFYERHPLDVASPAAWAAVPSTSTAGSIRSSETFSSRTRSERSSLRSGIEFAAPDRLTLTPALPVPSTVRDDCVEVMGFEPTASSMRPKRSSQLSYTPVRDCSS
jgi:hypothetical protein